MSHNTFAVEGSDHYYLVTEPGNLSSIPPITPIPILHHCDMCAVLFYSKGQSPSDTQKHEKVDYDCNQCGGNFSNQNNFIFTRNPSMMDWDMTVINVMKVLDHMVNFRTIHKKTIRNCDQCDDTFKDKNTLNRNKHSKHEVWLSSMTGLLCMVYYKKYTHEQALWVFWCYKKFKHDGLRYNCY